MSESLTINVKLLADGSALIGQTRLSREEVEKLRKESDQTTSSFDKLSAAGSTLVKAFGGLAVLSTIVKTTSDLDATTKQLAASLGITTQAAQEYADIGRDLYDDAFGASLQQTATAVADTTKRFSDLGVTARSEIESITAKAFTLEQFGDDYGKQLAAAETLMQDFGLSHEQAFDLIAGGYQRGLNAGGDFLESITEYAPQFKNAGADAGQFFSIMETGMQNGILGTDKASDMFKEFNVRLLDGSKGTKEALEQIGLSAEQVAAQINSGNMSVTDIFSEVLDRLRETDDQAIQMQAGVGLLGAQFEDLGLSAALGVDLTKTKLDDLTGSMSMAEQANETLNTKMTSAWRSVSTALADSGAAHALVDVLGQAADAVTYLAQNSEKLEPLVAVVGVGGALVLGFKYLPTVIAAANTGLVTLSRTYAVLTASTTATLIPTNRLEMTLLAMKANIASQPTLWSKLSTSIYGTGVSAQFASGWMGKLQVAGGLAFAAFAGWEIGSYLYNEFEVARNAGLAFVGATLSGWEYVKFGAAAAGDFVASSFESSFIWVQSTAIDAVAFVSRNWVFIQTSFDSVLMGVRQIWASTLSSITGSLSGFSEKVGGVLFALGADDTAGDLYNLSESLRKASVEYKSTASASNTLSSSYQNQISSINAQVAAQKSALTQSGDYKSRLASLRAERDANIGSIDGIVTSMIAEGRAVDTTKKQVLDLGNQQKEASKIADDTTGANTKLGQSLGDVEGGAGGAKNALKETAAQINETGKAAEQARDAIEDMLEKLQEREATMGMDEASKDAYEYAKALAETGDYTEQQIAEERKLYEEKVRHLDLVEEQIKAFEELNATVAKSYLSSEAASYFDLMQKIGVEAGAQVAQFEALAKARQAGNERIASLQEEITLLGMSAEAQDRYNNLKDIAPEQRETVNALLEQKQTIEQTREQWESVADTAADYFSDVADGSMSFSDALKGFAKDMQKDFFKQSFEKGKNQLMQWLTGSSEQDTMQAALAAADAKVQQDVKAASVAFEEYEKKLTDSTADAAKTLVKGVETSVDKLGAGIDKTLLGLTKGLGALGEKVGPATGTATGLEIESEASATGLLKAATASAESSDLLADSHLSQASALAEAQQSIEGFAESSATSAQLLAESSVKMAQTTGQAATAMAQAGMQAEQGGGFLSNLFSGDGMLGGIGKMFSGDGMLGGIGKMFSGDGMLGGIGKMLGGGGAGGGIGKMLGGNIGGLLSTGMSLFEGDWKGALSSGLTMGLTALGGPIGSALSMAVGPVMGKMFGEWEVEAQHLTAEIDGLSAAFQMKTIEVNKGMIGGGKRETYTDLDEETNAQLQQAMQSVVNQIEEVSKRIGQSLTDNFRFSGVADIVHEDTDDFETQFARLQSTMIKNAFTEANIAGVDTDIQSVMADKVENVMKSAADGIYNKSLQHFMWKPGTEKYADTIRGDIQTGLNDLIATTDWSGLDAEGQLETLETYLTDAFNSAGISVDPGTFEAMAQDFAAQINDGMQFLADNEGVVDPDAGFFRNMREIVNNFNEWDANPEEVSAFIHSLLGLKDAFNLVGYDAGLISQQLIDAAGDVGVLSDNMGAFYENFLTEEEQRANKLEMLSNNLSRSFADLGMEMPRTRESFRKLVDDMAADMADPDLFADTIALSDELGQYFDLLGDGMSGAASSLLDLVNQFDVLGNAITQQDIAGWFKESVMNAETAQEASQTFAQSFSEGIRQQMVDVVLQSVSNTIYQGIVTPMLEAATLSAQQDVMSATTSANIDMQGAAQSASMETQSAAQAASMETQGASSEVAQELTGSSTAAALLAQGGATAANYLASIVAEAKAQLEVMKAVMADEEISALINEVAGVGGEIAGATFNTLNAPSSVVSAPIMPSYSSNLTSSVSRSTSSNNSSSSSNSDAENERKKAEEEEKKQAEMIADYRNTFDDLASGLDDIELTIYQLEKEFANADLTMLDFTASSKDLAAQMLSLDDSKLKEIAAQTGKTINEVSSGFEKAVELIRKQEEGWSEFTEKMSAAGRGLGDLDDLTRSMVQLEDKFQGLDITFLALNVGAEDLAQQWADMPIKEARQHAANLGISLEELQENAELAATAIDELQAKFADFRTQVQEFSSSPIDQGQVIADKYGVDLAGLKSRDLADSILAADDQQIAAFAQQFGVTVDELMRDAMTLLEVTEVNTQAFDEFGKGLKDAGYTLRDTVKSLKLSDLSTFTNKEKLNEAQAQYDELYKRAAAGDLEAVGELQSISQTLLEQGRQFWGSSDKYGDLFNEVTSGLDSLGVAYEAASEDELLAAMFMDASQLSTEQITGKLSELKDEYGLSTEQIVEAIKGGYFGLSDEQQTGVFTSMTGNKAGVTDAQINSAITEVGASGLFSESEMAAMIREQMVSNGISAEQVARSVGVSMQDYTAFMDQQIGSAVNGLIQQVQSGAMGADSAIAQLGGAMERFGIGREELARSTGLDLSDVEAFADQHNLPKLAEGGYVDQPTLALIGERGPEVVVPLNKGGNGQSNAELKVLLERLVQAEQETQRILNAILQNNQQGSSNVVKTLEQQPKKTALLLGQKIESLKGK